MPALATSLVPSRDLRISGGPLKPLEQSSVNWSSANLFIGPIRHKKLAISKSRLTVRAGYRDGGRPSSASIFVGGFVLGGIIAGALGCVYAPQISKALGGADRKELMKKLQKFMYDEEKALEKTRKVLAEKIAQLNSAIDEVSSQLQADDGPNVVAVSSDEVETAI